MSLGDPVDTITLTYDGDSPQSISVENIDVIRAFISGNGGGAANGTDSASGVGGDGGYLEVEANVEQDDTLTAYVPDGRWGYNSGGEGGSFAFTVGGAGGGSAALLDSSGSLFGEVGGGGGAGRARDTETASGGGGAPGGAGGAASSSDSDDGQDAEGSGTFGGDGGDASTNPLTGEDGEPGGQSAGPRADQVLSQEVGGGSPGGPNDGAGFGPESGAEIVVELYSTLESPQNVSVTDERPTETDLGWTNPDDYDEIQIYRSQTAGIDVANETPIDTIAGSAESYTDAGLNNGITYFYVVVGSVSGVSEASAEVSGTTVLNAPTITDVTNPSASTVDVAFTIPGEVSGGDLTLERDGADIASIPLADREITDTDAPDGATPEYVVRRTSVDAEASSAPESIQTLLPDEDQPVLGNGVEDEVAVDRETAVSNNGDVRIQIRETGESAWDSSAEGFSEFISAFDTLTMAFVGREDGVRYEVRARTETESVTGAWTEPVAITTEFPAVTNLTATAISETEVELTWDDNADNEAGQLVVRERLVDGEWWPERVIEDVGPNTETFVDDTVPPDTEVRYRIRAFTPYTEADSNTDTATTDDIGLSRRRIPASGWYAEVETPNGDLLRPTILTESQPQPQLNDTPEVELALPSNDRWLDPELDRATLRVWRDGERLPISRVEISGNSSSQSTLIGRGGVALDEVVARDVDDLIPTHEFVDQLLTKLDIPHVVDDPASDTRADVGVLSAPGISSLVDTFREVDGATGNDIPIEADVDAGALELQQAAWARAADFADTTDAPIDDLDPAPETYWGDRPYALESSGDTISWTFSSAYEWPADQAEAKIRLHAPQEEHPSFVVRLDGKVIDDFPADNGLQEEADPSWTTFFAQGPAFDGVTISAGTTVEIEATSDSSGKVVVDGGGLLDSEYDSGISFTGTSIDQGGQLVGLDLHPEALDLTTDDVGTIEQVVGGSVDVDLDNTEGAQALAVSNDGGTTWQSASNTESLDATFNEGSTQLRARVTLSRYDDGGQFGAGQSISNLSLAADLDDTPFLEAEAFENSVSGLLTKLANRQRFAWEVQSPDRHPDLDAEGDDPGVVVFTQLGQREASTNAPVLDYEVRRNSSTVVDTVIAYGPSRRVEDERVVLTGLGYVGIGDDYLQPGTVRVYQPGADGDPDTVYDPDEDYRLLRNDGSIARREGSAIGDGEEVHLDYETRRRAEYTLPGADGTGDTIRETFENAVTQRALEQAALFTAKRLADPQRQATVELARDNLGYQLVDALAVADVPGLNEPRRIANVNVQTDRVSVDLGEKQSAGDVVDSINRRLSGLAERL